MNGKVEVTLPDELVEELAERVLARVREELPGADEDPWLDVRAAAAYISAPASRIYDLKALGRLQHRKDGSRLLVRRSWLDAYLDGPNRG